MKKLLALFLSLLCLTACSSHGQTGAVTEQTPTETVTIMSDYAAVTFEEAVERAAVIVYGTVTAKSVTQPNETQYSDGHTSYDPYRNVTIEVDTLFKGGSGNSPVVYRELGGIVGSTEYVHYALEITEVGDRVLLFLNEDGYFLCPDVLSIADEDGNISVGSNMLPVAPGQARPARYTVTSMPIGDYCGIIRDYLTR